MIVSYVHQASGSRGEVGSATFYTCRTCGACIIEMHGRSTESRKLHDQWHVQAVIAERSET